MNNKIYRFKSSFAPPSIRNILTFDMLVMILVSAGTVAFGADEIKNQDKAEVLKRLQLFQGTNNGYDLDKVFTRAQGAVMLLRLFGWEDEAIKADENSAFTDAKKPHWAASFISYAYNKGLVKGVTDTKFATEEAMNGSQFIALTLRALGYMKAEPAQALEFAGTSGLLDADDTARLIGKKIFLRDDMIEVAYHALTTKLSSSEKTLLQKLVEDDHAVNLDVALATGLYKESINLPKSEDPLDQIESAIRKALNP
jgi:hypothetical protein